MALNFPDFEIPSLSQIWAETSAGPSGSFPLISGSSRQFIIFFSAEARQRRGSRISAQFIMRVVAYQGVCVCARDVAFHVRVDDEFSFSHCQSKTCRLLLPQRDYPPCRTGSIFKENPQTRELEWTGCQNMFNLLLSTSTGGRVA